MTTPSPLRHTRRADSTDRSAPDLLDWVPLPGGELEAPRLRALCQACREARQQATQRGQVFRRSQPLCFACYRADGEHQRRLAAAVVLETASEERFQYTLPFEPVNRARLHQLRAARLAERAVEQQGIGRFADARRQAQIAARHALDRVMEELKTRGALAADRAPLPAHAVRAVELQLPDSWLPFVVSR